MKKGFKNGFPISTDVLSLASVLEDKYSIPEYQRPYEWNENNIDQFLESIISGFKDGAFNVFFGTIQIDKREESIDKGRIDIVDGQQRLISFLLLLKVVSENYNLDFLYEDTIRNDSNDMLYKALRASEKEINEMQGNLKDRFLLNKNLLYKKTKQLFDNRTPSFIRGCFCI